MSAILYLNLFAFYTRIDFATTSISNLIDSLLSDIQQIPALFLIAGTKITV
jgi:hypothetical protein